MHQPRHIASDKHRCQKKNEEDCPRRKQEYGNNSEGEENFEHEEVSLNEPVPEEITYGGEPGAVPPAHENLRRRCRRRASKDGLRDVYKIEESDS